MPLYEPEETDVSLRYLLALAKEFGCDELGIIGGWATYFIVDTGYREATGNEYLRSRDIDVFISSAPSFVKKFSSGIRRAGFSPGAYPFRYSLIVKRDSGRVLSREEARSAPSYETISVDLDVFSGKKVEIGTWVLPAAQGVLGKGSKVTERDGIKIRIPDSGLGLELKAKTYIARDREHKRIKDACDIYALLFYSGLKKHGVPGATGEAINNITSSGDTVYIAEHLFGGSSADMLVRRNLENVSRRWGK